MRIRLAYMILFFCFLSSASFAEYIAETYVVSAASGALILDEAKESSKKLALIPYLSEVWQPEKCSEAITINGVTGC